MHNGCILMNTSLNVITTTCITVQGGQAVCDRTLSIFEIEKNSKYLNEYH